MRRIEIDLDEATFARLQSRAERTGVNLESFVQKVLVRLLAQDPYEFVGAGSSPRLRGRDADQHLAKGFGREA